MRPERTLLERDLAVPAGLSGILPARLYAPRAAARLPHVLHLHGGAFTAGGVEAGGRMARLLARSGAAVLSLAYPLAPAHRFPAAVDAVVRTLAWMRADPTWTSAAPAALLLAGEESGACIAVAAAMMCRDQCGPALAGQVLVAPMLDPRVATPSFRSFNGCATACRWERGWRAYLGSPADVDHPYAVPALSRRLGGLPSTLLLAAADDPTRDEAGEFAQRLCAAGVPVAHEVFPAPSGWPCSLAAAEGAEPAPDAAVGRRLRAFLQALPPSQGD